MKIFYTFKLEFAEREREREGGCKKERVKYFKSNLNDLMRKMENNLLNSIVSNCDK